MISGLAICAWVTKDGLGRTKAVTDAHLCAAVVDRLTINGAIIATGTKSHRVARTKAGVARMHTRSA
ncbi:hypothetical protein [Peterkaempfera sp. SMS 1(5)a]|uniref:hypothetical protein n=1 Tax=Peterkaempfera podocarpi TaxID=3232308 RepID=UPI00366FF489